MDNDRYEINKKFFRNLKGELYPASVLIDKLLFIDDKLEELDSLKDKLNYLESIDILITQFAENVNDGKFDSLIDEGYIILFDRLREVLNDNKIAMFYINRNPDYWIEDIFDLMRIVLNEDKK